MSGGEWSVYQFFPDKSWERVREFVALENALEAFQHYTTSVAARNGMVARVIITDGGDCTAYEWKHGQGLTYPPKEQAGQA